MKINREALLEELKFVANAVERRSTVPILSNILWAFEGETLRLKATDTQVTLEAEIDLATPPSGPGRFALPGYESIVLLGELTGSEIDIRVEGGEWSARDARGAFARLRHGDPEDFPEQPAMEATRPIALDPERVRSAIRGVQHAGKVTGQSGFGFALAPGADKEVTVAATDGKRLSINGDLQAFEWERRGELIRLGPDAIRAMSGLSNGEGEKLDWTLNRDGHRVLVSAGRRKASFRLIEGVFPDIFSVVNRSRGAQHFRTQRAPFLAAARAAAACPGNTGPIALSICEEGGLALDAIGDFTEFHVPCDATVEGERLKVGVNPTYLVEFLESIEEDEITVHYKGGDPMHALHYESSAGDKEGAPREWRVVMPMSIPSLAKQEGMTSGSSAPPPAESVAGEVPTEEATK